MLRKASVLALLTDVLPFRQALRLVSPLYTPKQVVFAFQVLSVHEYQVLGEELPQIRNRHQREWDPDEREGDANYLDWRQMVARIEAHCELGEQTKARARKIWKKLFQDYLAEAGYWYWVAVADCC